MTLFLLVVDNKKYLRMLRISFFGNVVYKPRDSTNLLNMKLCRDFIKSKLFYRLDFHKVTSVIFHFSCEHTPPANQINILFQNFIAFFSLTSFAFQSISLFLCIFVFFAKQNAFPLKEKSRQKKTTQSIEKKMDVTMTPKKGRKLPYYESFKWWWQCYTDAALGDCTMKQRFSTCLQIYYFKIDSF